MHVKDEPFRTAIGIGDLQQRGPASVHRVDALGAGEVAAREQNHVLSARHADCGDGGLRRVGPRRDTQQIVRLVHQPEGDARVVAVLGRKLTPQAVELRIRGTPWRLRNDIPVPPRIVVDVYDTEGCAGIQTALDQGVVVGEVCRVQGTAEVVVHEVLPGDWETEGVEAILLHEVIHLLEGGAVGNDV